MFAILPLGSFLIARVGDRSREGQRVCIKVARWEFAAWSPWGDCWVPEITWVSNRRLQKPTWPWYCPSWWVAGWTQQAEERPDSDVQQKWPEQASPFFTWTRMEARQRTLMPHMVLSVWDRRRRRREEADRIVLVHCSALLASHEIWGKRLMGALLTQTLLRISRSIQKKCHKMKY